MYRSYPRYQYYGSKRYKGNVWHKYRPFAVAAIIAILMYHYAGQIITWLVIISGWVKDIIV